MSEIKEPQKEVPLVEQVDLEQHAKEGKRPPKARNYRIRVDDAYFLIPKATITGREILTLVGADPATKYVTMRMHGGHPPLREVGLDEVVDLTAPGVERFFVRDRQSQPG